MSACHPAATSACRGFNDRYSSTSAAPRPRLPQERNLHRLPGTHSSAPPLWLQGTFRFPAVRARLLAAEVSDIQSENLHVIPGGGGASLLPGSAELNNPLWFDKRVFKKAPEKQNRMAGG